MKNKKKTKVDIDIKLILYSILSMTIGSLLMEVYATFFFAPEYYDGLLNSLKLKWGDWEYVKALFHDPIYLTMFILTFVPSTSIIGYFNAKSFSENWLEKRRKNSK